MSKTITDEETTMTTETTTPADRAKQISDRLLEIAPYPERTEDVTALDLARYLGVRAQVIWSQQVSEMGDRDHSADHQRIDLMTILLAASHALFAAHDRDRTHADLVAREIWSAWENGDGIGELLWHHLGDGACREVSSLAAELAALENAETPAAKVVKDAEQVEATAAILNRRYPSARPEQLDATISDLQAIARSWRRQAAQVEAAGAAVAK